MKSLNPNNRLSIPSLSVLCGALLTTTIFLSTSTAQAASPFTTEGKFSVGSDGSANYSIPIVVPPGTAGMQPQLALNYNSNGGNGIVGMGWGIDGLSQISRCGTTLEQDGVINGVTYTNTDRFCIDGQRLIATSDSYNTSSKQYSTTSAYGANGTEYRTESANFAKIISYGQAGNGPAYFKVWTKSGQIIEYGNTTDSAIEAQGKPTIRNWGVNKISDTKGNYITVSYTEDNANGEAYVSRIDYTGNANSTPALNPYANVQFIYEARPDTTIAYQAGSVLKTTKRLTNIQTYNGSTQVKSYKLGYEQTQSTNRTRLRTFTECDGNVSAQSCKKQLVFNWIESVDGWASPALWLSHGDSQLGQMQYADVNGDGFADSLYFDVSRSRQVWVGLSTGTSFATPNPWITQGESTSDQVQYVDVNGDGLVDSLYFDTFRSRKVWVAISTGTGFSEQSAWIAQGDSTPDQVQYVDVNGDGLPDSMYFDITRSHGFWFGASTGTGFPTQYMTVVHGGEQSASQVHYADLNGDGLADLIFQGLDNKFWVSLSTGNSFSAPAQWMQHGGSFQAGQAAYADLNGDGLADLIFQGLDNKFWVSLSTGNSFSTPAQWMQHGESFKAGQVTYVDVNGDGLPDLLFQGSDNKFWVSLRNGSLANRISSISTNTLSLSSITYNSITDAALYLKDTTANYPIQDIQSPMYVVSSTSVSDGLGGVVTTNYQYGGLKAHLRGRGSLGFRYVKESSPDSGLSVTTFYRQDFPFIGLPSQVEKRRLSDNALLSVVQNTYANTDLTTGSMLSKFPYLSQSVEQAYELDGSLVSTTTTTNQYDGYGNVTSVKVDDGLGNTKTTTSTYNNDVSNWLLGRLIRSTVTSVTP